MPSNPIARSDRSAGEITEFPVTRAASSLPLPHDENDYLPDIFEAPAGIATTREVKGRVAWASSDRLSPCYSHLLIGDGDHVTVDKTFDVGKAELELLIGANLYQPRGKNDIIAFGIRGARLRGTEKVELVDRFPLEDTRPDHKNFRCVIGYYFRATGKLSAFTGSTVPWQGYMSGGVKNNLLPTGCYIYKKGVHRPQTESRWVDPALRLSDADGAESGPATVLRTTRDLTFDMTDDWDYCAPSDNIHCAYSDGQFSSLGCQTIKGGLHDGLWAIFQSTLKALPASSRVDYVLFTGAEFSIAASLVKAGNRVGDPIVSARLGRLRSGSEGEEVKRLQARLDTEVTGYFGAATKKKLTDVQRAHGIAADGIFSPALDKTLGWDVLSPRPASPAPEPAPIVAAPQPADQQPPQAGAPAVQIASAAPPPLAILVPAENAAPAPDGVATRSSTRSGDTIGSSGRSDRARAGWLWASILVLAAVAVALFLYFGKWR